MKICPECGEEFDPMWRVEIDAELEPYQLAGVLSQVIYCSKKCKNKRRNRDYYQKHKKRIIKCVQKRRKKNDVLD